MVNLYQRVNLYVNPRDIRDIRDIRDHVGKKTVLFAAWDHHNGLDVPTKSTEPL